MENITSIFWFRQDLRLSDNPGLLQACKIGKVLPIYVYDDACPKEFEMGSASKTWLYYSLKSLQKSLNNNLNFYIGNSASIINELILRYKITNVFWSNSYEPNNIQQELKVKKMLSELNVSYKNYNSSYLFSPEDILKDDGSYYKVFTAYKKKLGVLSPRLPASKPKTLNLIKDEHNKNTIEDFHFISNHEWHKKVMRQWRVGEDAATQALSEFIDKHLNGYKINRDFPGKDNVSRLSPHLHFGEISPFQILNAVNSIGIIKASQQDIDCFLNEIIWREFSCYLLYHFSKLYTENFLSKFNQFPWVKNNALLNKWKTGNTGFPIVDAGMRELWQTGYMHNRVRMIVASFLVKNLMIHWHCGRDWFWDCLVDADLANNSTGWQWVAGSGADAAPYFRIFNPITQGEKFDRVGDYTRKYVPELKLLPDKYLFKPWLAPEKLLKDAGIVLGVNYPKPIIDLKSSRELALLEYRRMVASFH